MKIPVLLALPENKIENFVKLLEEIKSGAESFAFPVLKLTYFQDIFLPDLNSFDCLIITSAFAAKKFVEMLQKQDLPKDLFLASLGPSVAEELEKAGLRTNFIPNEFNANALAEKLKQNNFCKNKKFLFLRGEKIASNILKQTIEKEGGNYTELIVYYSELVQELVWNNFDEFSKSCASTKFICLSSPEGVIAFKKALQAKQKQLPANICFICLGPATEEETKKCFPIHKVCCPANYSYNGMIEIIKKEYL